MNRYNSYFSYSLTTPHYRSVSYKIIAHSNLTPTHNCIINDHVIKHDAFTSTSCVVIPKLNFAGIVPDHLTSNFSTLVSTPSQTFYKPSSSPYLNFSSFGTSQPTLSLQLVGSKTDNKYFIAQFLNLNNSMIFYRENNRWHKQTNVKSHRFNSQKTTHIYLISDPPEEALSYLDTSTFDCLALDQSVNNIESKLNFFSEQSGTTYLSTTPYADELHQQRVASLALRPVPTVPPPKPPASRPPMSPPPTPASQKRLVVPSHQTNPFRLLDTSFFIYRSEHSQSQPITTHKSVSLIPSGGSIIGLYTSHLTDTKSPSPLPSAQASTEFPELLTSHFQVFSDEDLRTLWDTYFKEVDERIRLKSDYGGTSATVCVCRGGFLYTAFVGDIKAILIGKNKRSSLTKPHTPDNPDELFRLKTVCDSKSPLVNLETEFGKISYTRSLGDALIKSHDTNKLSDSLLITNEPDSSVVPLTADHSYLVLCSSSVLQLTQELSALDLKERLSPTSSFLHYFFEFLDTQPHKPESISKQFLEYLISKTKKSPNKSINDILKGSTEMSVLISTIDSES